MAENRDDDLTLLLNRAQQGDEEAAREAWGRIYRELRGMAASAASKESDYTEPTTVLQEAYLRVAGNERWENRRHFFGAMRLAMQRFLIDRARRRDARVDMKSRGRVDLTLADGELADLDKASSDTGVALMKALEELEQTDPEAAAVVHMKYIAEMTIAQIAGELGVSEGTVKNRWRAARATLREKLAGQISGESDADG